MAGTTADLLSVGWGAGLAPSIGDIPETEPYIIQVTDAYVRHGTSTC